MPEAPSLLSGRVNRQTMTWLIVAVLAGTVIEAATSSHPLVMPSIPVRVVLLVAIWLALRSQRITPLMAGRLLLAMGVVTALLWSYVLGSTGYRVAFEAVAYGAILSIFAIMVAPLQQRYLWAGLVNLAVLIHAGFTLLPEDAVIVGQTVVVLGIHTVAVATMDQYASRVQSAGDRDPLTQLFNRRPMVQRLTSWIASGGPSRGTSSIVIADLDDFKELNDTAGHEAGDAALCRVADVLRTAVAPRDAVCRWGGEEFLIFLPDLDVEQAVVIAERLRQQVDVTGVTASFGVAQCDPEDTMSSWVSRADQAMYTAKRNGRNRVEVAPPRDGRPLTV